MFIIDRFEGDWAVIEYQNKTFNIPRELLPGGSQEGDVLTVEISLNKKATEERRDRIQGLMDDLFN
ncbi:MAG: DUF3006 domain-containing protein [Clostridia bacterium]|nr:DUF3006 domain-containing protein [Clostridia bacterium]